MKIGLGFAALALLGSAAGTARAAELKPETLKAWDQYVEEANARLQERLRDGGKFLWIDESPERGKQVRDDRNP